ncbi:hypothetical protein NBRC116494_30480 [Aurantivibrio plasticivorans]
MKAYRYSSKDWFGKASAGLVLGFLLSLALGGLVVRYLVGGATPFSIPHQFAMWLTAPLMLLFLSACFMFRSGLQAWGGFALLNFVAWGVLLIP